MQRDLTDITAELGRVYRQEQKAKAEREKLRKEFFDAATAQVRLHGATQTIVLEARLLRQDRARQYIEQRNPGWLVKHLELVHEDGRAEWRAVIEEDPALQPFVFVNPTDGQTYERQITQGSLLLDDDRLKEEYPDLWEAVTYVPEPKRELRPLEELTADQLERISDYLYYGVPSQRLAPPKKGSE